jgi:hypothetical protein
VGNLVFSSQGVLLRAWLKLKEKGEKYVNNKQQRNEGCIRNGRIFKFISKEDTCLEMMLRCGFTIPYREIS